MATGTWWTLERDTAGRPRPRAGSGNGGGAGPGVGTRTILVVDDDDSIREMLRDVLRASGYGVREAADGAAALEAVEAERPALVLLDMRMPRVDGWEFARRLRERGHAVPLVVMTAIPAARHTADEIGAVGYLAKPFDIDEMLTQVAAHTGDRSS